MDKDFNIVLSVQDNFIRFFCTDSSKFKFLKESGAKKVLFKKGMWKVEYTSKLELLKYFSELRDEKFIFASGSNGWQPSDIFKALRKDGFLEGKFIEAIWKNKNAIEIREV